MNKEIYKNISKDEIREAFKQQTDDKTWTFYDERQFIENLLQTRFNFLLAAYSLFLVTLFSTNENTMQKIIVIIGILIFGLMWLTVYRLYVKLILLLKITRDIHEKHVVPITDKEIEGNKAHNADKKPDENEKSTGLKFRLFSVNIIIGVIIPLIMLLSFILFLILLFFGGYTLT